MSRRLGLPPDHESLAGISDEAVTKATGMGWGAWADVLDDAGAASWSHKEIAAWTKENHEGVTGWWAQSVTVAYERFRGLRDVGQRRDGDYEVNKSKTISAPVETLWRALTDEDLRRSWLDREVEIRTANEPRSVRMTLSDGTALDAYLTAKGSGKATITLQHRKLPDRAASEKLKTYWGERLEVLARSVESGAPGTQQYPRKR